MLILDSEGVSAIVHGPVGRQQKVRALIQEMRSEGRAIGTVAAVLAEVVRGRPADAEVFAALRRERVDVRPVDRRVVIRAGQLLGRIGSGSELAVDAFVVAVAELAGGAVVATTDGRDVRLLAESARHVRVVDISEK
jgi:predicted nucleic acid-binding protein